MAKTLTYCESLTYRSDSGRCCQRSSRRFFLVVNI